MDIQWNSVQYQCTFFCIKCATFTILRVQLLHRGWVSDRNYETLWYHIDGLVQDCSNSSALAMELLQSCTKPSIYYRNSQGLGQKCSLKNIAKLLPKQTYPSHFYELRIHKKNDGLYKVCLSCDVCVK